MPNDFDPAVLSYLEPKHRRWYTLEGVYYPPDNPVAVEIELVHAGRSNVAYTNAMLKLQHERGLDGNTAAALDAQDAAHNKLFARHVVTGWRNVGPADQPVPYGTDKVEALLNALATRFKRPEIVNRAAAYAADADNFRDEPIGSAEQLGKG